MCGCSSNVSAVSAIVHSNASALSENMELKDHMNDDGSIKIMIAAKKSVYVTLMTGEQVNASGGQVIFVSPATANTLVRSGIAILVKNS